MISHAFHNSWNIQPEDSLITHEPADISQSWKIFWKSWASRCQLRRQFSRAYWFRSTHIAPEMHHRFLECCPDTHSSMAWTCTWHYYHSTWTYTQLFVSGNKQHWPFLKHILEFMSHLSRTHIFSLIFCILYGFIWWSISVWFLIIRNDKMVGHVLSPRA